VAASLWGVAAPLSWRLASGATALYAPSPWAVRGGLALGLAGFALVSWCVVTLGPRRFFMWPVLRPEPGPAERVTRGPYQFLTHPTYVSLVATLLGHFLASGMTVLLGGAAILGGLLTLVTTLEERELASRVEVAPPPATSVSPEA